MKVQTCHGLLRRRQNAVELGPQPILELGEWARVWLDRENDVSGVVNLALGIARPERLGFGVDGLEYLVDLGDLGSSRSTF